MGWKYWKKKCGKLEKILVNNGFSIYELRRNKKMYYSKKLNAKKTLKETYKNYFKILKKFKEIEPTFPSYISKMHDYW